MVYSDAADVLVDTDSRRLKILFLTRLDPHDKRSWSGIVYYTAQALQKHCGDVSSIDSPFLLQRSLGRIFAKSVQVLLHKSYKYNDSPAVAREYARIINRRLKEQEYDVIVAPTGASEIAFLQTDIPMVLVEDATFALLHNYYPQYSHIMKRSVDESHQVQQAAITNASTLIYSSSWAARSAIDVYHADPKKVHVIPFGANLDQAPAKELALKPRAGDCCRLFFLGVDWQRKGGEIAFETLLALRQMDIPAELVVCGCVPPKHITHPDMRVIPFLDKNDPAQYQELIQLYLTSNFLLLPSRNECFGIVYCEASAFGLPVITTDTGGITGAVENNVNGFTLPLSARGNEYAELIAELYRDQARYAALAKSSRAAFDDRLNWDRWALTLNAILHEVLKQKKGNLSRV
jgi:glycosyltransferase involved in cell wall biosynthesis